MTTVAIIEGGVILMEAILKEAPEIKALVLDYLNKDNPTLEERALLRARIVNSTYSNLVPDSKLPAEELNDDPIV